MYGVTIDEIAHVESFVSALAALPDRPTTRVYFDVREPASYYARALTQLDPVTAVMGELLDSSDETSISTEAFQARTESYLQTLGSDVNIWEVGNEVNGNWTGSYPTVAAKLTEAFDDVAAVGAKSALTLYANNFGPDHCGDGESELTPVQFSRQYIPAAVADGLNYVFLSYYPTQCHHREPTSQEVASYMQQLHALFPNAALGFGEVDAPQCGEAQSHQGGADPGLSSRAYSLQRVSLLVKFYVRWYGAEDAFHPDAPLRRCTARSVRGQVPGIGARRPVMGRSARPNYSCIRQSGAQAGAAVRWMT